MVNLSRFKAVIFDFDGVLVDSETLQAEAWRRLGAEMNLADFKVDIEKIAGRWDRHIAPDLFGARPDIEQCITRKWAIQDEMEFAGLMQPIAGAIPLLHRLSKTHALAIASSSWPHKIDRWLIRENLKPLFKSIVACGNTITCKPAPDCYLNALSELGVKPTEACAFEDSPTGLAAAKAAGLFAIQLQHP